MLSKKRPTTRSRSTNEASNSQKSYRTESRWRRPISLHLTWTCQNVERKDCLIILEPKWPRQQKAIRSQPLPPQPNETHTVHGQIVTSTLCVHSNNLSLCTCVSFHSVPSQPRDNHAQAYATGACLCFTRAAETPPMS